MPTPQGTSYAEPQHPAADATPDWPPITIGQAKRVLEWWSSSAVFRELVATDPERAGRDYKLGFSPELIRPLWDDRYHLDAANKDRPQHPIVAEYRAYYHTKTQWRDEVKRECAPDEPRLKTWRTRQIARNAMENGLYDSSIIHSPLAIELSDGCSVGCWFCGVGATRFVETWDYTEENATLWRGVLSVLHDKIGDASKWGFCYWATDPLDNPDYEHFASDFADITGMFPQTTTAQGHKDPERVLKLLRLSESRGCKVNRFSVLTESLLRRIHDAYTADELTQVEIVAQMRDATVPKADAGSFRVKARKTANVVEREKKKLIPIAVSENGTEDSDKPALTMQQPGTIACVTGFLLNMVRRSVKLISPCRASEQWPLGYIVFEECTFTDAADLERKIEAMIETHMPQELTPDDPIQLNPSFRLEPVANGFRVLSDLSCIEFSRPTPDLVEYLGALGEHVTSGKRTAGEIAVSSLFCYGVPETNTLSTLGAMLNLGILVDARGRITGQSAVEAQ